MSQQKEIGTLVVVVLKAQHLHQPSFYKQNPYTEVSLSGLKKRTKVDLKGGQHPVWDEEFRFPVLADAGKDNLNRVLEVSCFKEEQRGEDVILGKGTVDIEGTLKTGEFDDWIPLVTSAGARGEVYLEMTFYANSPPPLTRRPSKLNPSDRPARPATYFSPSQQPNPPSTSPSPQRKRSPERKPRQTSTSVNQIPSSLIPAHSPKSQPSRQPPSNGGAISVIAVKHKDSLPPLPTNDSHEVASGKNSGVPAALHPGGRSGPRPMLPLSRTRMTSMGQPPPELLPEQLHRRAVSDIPVLTPFSQLQAPLQTCTPEMSSMTGPGDPLAPSIIVEEHVKEHPRIAFPTPTAPSPGAIQEREPRGYIAGSYGSPGQVYLQGHALEGYSQTFSPAQHSVPSQSPQQPYDTFPPMTSPSPRPQQYSASSDGALALQTLSSPQAYLHLRNSNQPQQQQTSYPPQPQQYYPFQQQSFVPLQKLQYLPPPQQQACYPQHLSYTQTPHIPNVPQRCEENTIASPPQPPPYPQIQHLTAPLPLPLQSQTPPSYASQPTHQSQSYFSPPPPPPPPLPSPQFNDQGEGTSSVVSVAVPSQAQVLPSASNRGQSPASAAPAAKSLTTTPSPSSVVNAPTSSAEEAFRERPAEEGKNEAKPVTEAETKMEEKVRNTPGNVNQDQNKQGQLNQSEDMVQESHEAKENRRQIEDIDQQDDNEESQKKGELKRREREQQEAERRILEEEERRRQEEVYKRREEEEQRKWEEKRKEREEIELKNEECRIREGEERRKRDEDERKKREEDRRRRVEEERRIREEECRKRDEDERRKREEEHRKQEEEECRRREEEAERRREEARRRAEAEAEKKWQEELARIRVRAEQEAADAAFARAQMEAEEAERRRQEEADLALLRQVQEEAEQEEILVQGRRRQEEADMEVARREQAHEEELERRRQKERKRRIEEADRELARKLDMELNLDKEQSGAPSSGRR